MLQSNVPCEERLQGYIHAHISLKAELEENLFDVTYSGRPDENVLQGIFDNMAQHWLGKPTPLSHDVIQPVYDLVQRLL